MAVMDAERHLMVRYGIGGIGQSDSHILINRSYGFHQKFHVGRTEQPLKGERVNGNYGINAGRDLVGVAQEQHYILSAVAERYESVAQLGPRAYVKPYERIVEHKDVGTGKKGVYYQ